MSSWLQRPASRWIVRAVTFLLIMVAWQLYADPRPRALIAPPTEVVAALFRQAITDGNLWGPLGSSMFTLVLGLGLTIAVGVPIGLAMGSFRRLEYVLDPYVTFLYVLPSVAFVPLLVIWFGFELQLRLVLVFLSGVFPLIIATMLCPPRCRSSSPASGSPSRRRGSASSSPR